VALGQHLVPRDRPAPAAAVPVAVTEVALPRGAELALGQHDAAGLGLGSAHPVVGHAPGAVGESLQLGELVHLSSRSLVSWWFLETVGEAGARGRTKPLPPGSGAHRAQPSICAALSQT